jgi:uncharacterized repeat protein (TIGR01451 family)
MNLTRRFLPGNRLKRFEWLRLALAALALLTAVPTGATPAPKGGTFGLTKTVDHPNDLVGSYFQFTVAVTNTGTSPANNVMVGDTLPSGLQLESSAAGAGSSYDVTGGMWTITNLLPGAGATLQMTALIAAPGLMTNTASILGSTNTASVVVYGVPVTGLMVVVKQLSAEGKALGPLVGATVLMSGALLGTTDAQGQLRNTNLTAGTYTVTVTNAGFYPVSHTVVVTTDQMTVSSYQMLEQSGPGPPSEFDFTSPQGNYFIPAMPGNMTFSVIVAWNGTPGTATFNVNGSAIPATLSDLGNGTWLATVTNAALATIGAANELTVNLVNGEGLSRAFNLGAYFEPLPGLVTSWYTWLGNVLYWVNASTNLGTLKIKYSYMTNFTIYSNSLPSDSLTVSSAVGLGFDLAFAPIVGTFNGSLGGTGTGNLTVNLPGTGGIEVFAEGSAGVKGTLKIAFAGLAPPKFTPGWEASLEVKNGLKAPVVSVVPVVLPAAAPAITFLQKVWLIKSVINSLKLGLTITEGGSVSGVYNNGFGNCFLWTTGLNGSVTAGVELEAGAKLGSLKAKVYGGGNGTLDFNLCPELGVNTITFQAYVGVSASAYIFSYDKKFTATLVFGGNAPQMRLLGAYGYPVKSMSDWEPIGARLERWGTPNRLAEPTGRRDALAAVGSTESLVVSNVLDLADPSVFADPSETDILFTLYDPTKPWYASTDIGALRSTNGGAWSLTKVTDDLMADFNPKVTGINSDLLLAAWERIDGDVSGTTNPVQVATDLEVVAAWFDRSTGTWSAPVQLTTNDVLDRDPLPVAFGSTQGILWVENQAGALIGDATNSDSLLYSQWTGTGWSQPQTLWSGTNGIPSFSFVADGSGQGHVVLAAENDALQESELYSLATVGGTWQSAIGLTNDAIENPQPTLVAPNGIPLCVWNQDGALVYTQLNPWNPRAVFSQITPANDATTLAGVTFPGGAAIGYAGQTLDEVDLYASFYNAAQDNWSLPSQLTQDQDGKSSVALAYDGTNLVAAFEDTAMVVTNLDFEVNGQTETLTNVSVPGQTDLYVLTHPPASDAGVVAGSLTVDPPNPAPGSNATISVVVENFGDLALQNVPVAFFDNGTQIGTQFIMSLIGGTTQEVDMAWVVPFATNSHTIEVIVDPNQTLPDRDRSNNSATLLTVLPDLAIQSVSSSEEGAFSMLLVAQVVNQGVIPAGPSVLSWNLDSADGQQIGTNSVGPLAPGQSVPVTFLWDTAGQYFSSAYVQVFAVADSLNQVVEFDETNNSAFLMVPIAATWVPQITGITNAGSGVVQLVFAAANSSPSDFVIQSTASLTPPISWQPEPSAAVTALSPGIFQAQLSAGGTSLFYRVQSTSTP